MGGLNWGQGLTNLSQGLGALAGHYARREEMDAEAERQARRDAANREFERAMQTDRIAADDKREGRAVEREQIRADLETSRQGILEKKADQTFELTKLAREDAAGARSDANATRNDTLEESRIRRETEVAKGIFDAAKSVEASLSQQELSAYEKWVTNNKPDFKNIVGEKAKAAAKDSWEKEQQEARSMYADMYKGMREEARTAREAAQERYSSYGGKMQAPQDGAETVNFKSVDEVVARLVKDHATGATPSDKTLVDNIKALAVGLPEGTLKSDEDVLRLAGRAKAEITKVRGSAPAPAQSPAAPAQAPAAPRTTAPAIPSPKPTAASPAGKPEAVAAREPSLIDDEDVWMQDQANMRRALASLPAKPSQDLITEDTGLPKTVVAQVNAAGLDPSDSREAAKKKLVAAGMTEQQFASFWQEIKAYLNKGTLTG